MDNDTQPRELQEGFDLLNHFYGFDRVGDSDRYLQAEAFRQDVYRLIVLQFHLSIEELLKSLIYDALPTRQTFTVKQNIEYLKGLNSRNAIDLAARLGLISKKGFEVLTQLNSIRNKMSHNWTVHSYRMRRQPGSGKRRRAYQVEFNGKNLLQLQVMKDEFIPLYSGVYLEFFAARYGLRWKPKYIKYWPRSSAEV